MYASGIQLQLRDGIDPVASVGGWSAPSYATSWNDVVQIVYARANYAENKRLNNTLQREYVTKSEVGAVIDAYRKSRQNRTSNGYNPANTSTMTATTQAVQTQLGQFSPEPTKITLILTQFYYAVFGSPQQIPSSWYTAGTAYRELTAEQKQALMISEGTAQNQATTQAPQQAEDTGFFATIGNSIKSIFALPGQLAQSAGQVAQGAGTTANMFQVMAPIVILGGGVFALWVIGRKVLEMDANELGATVATRGTNKIANR